MAACSAPQHDELRIHGMCSAAVGVAGALALKLPAYCTLPQAAALRVSLLDAVAAGGDVELDASSVETADTAGLQLLLAFKTQLQQQGRCIRWLHVGVPLQTAAQQLGLANLLDLAGQGTAP